MNRRRRLLAGSAAALAGGWSATLARARGIAPERRHGDLRDVAHIVVLTQENRSFDHYFGALNGVRGFADPFPLPRGGGRTVWQQPAAADAGRTLLPFHLDTRAHPGLMRVEGTPHLWPDALQAWDQGRLSNWPAAKRDHSLAHYRSIDLPWHVALADAFTLCDAYHCSFQGGTLPNRLFLWTGGIDPQGQGGGPVLDNAMEGFGEAGGSAGLRWTTYAERLQAAGVSWQVYQDVADHFGDNALAAFRVFRDAFHGRAGHDAELRRRGASTRTLQALRDDVRAHRLPQVSWVVAPAADSEHPGPSSPAQGADFSARVLDALLADPAVWSRTVLLLNYDENDGFFDHVPPPAPPSVLQGHDDPSRRRLAGHTQVDTRDEYHEHPARGQGSTGLHQPYGLGPRVPLFVVSPFSRGGWVCSEVFDHTSVLRFIERRFGVPVPEITPWRRAVCGDLTSAFDFAAGPDTRRLPPWPETRTAAARAATLPGTTRPGPPADPGPPQQAAGPRPARALPYALEARIAPVDGGLRLSLVNTGTAAAVLHRYDPLQPEAVPHRYTVAPGQTLNDILSAAADVAHDLWLLGPNGWHRRFSGSLDAGTPTVTLEWPGPTQPLLAVHNPGARPARLLLAQATYGSTGPRTMTVAALATLRLPLALTPHHWYDWTVSLADAPATAWRFAGHAEDGRPSISDPAMHGPAVLEDRAPRPAAMLSQSASTRPGLRQPLAAPQGAARRGLRG